MNIKMSKITDLYDMMHNCHVQTVNYFASFFGYSFPEHDADKIQETNKINYAYEMYKRCFPDFKLPDKYSEQLKDLKQQHYKKSPHHINHYSNVSEIPNTYLYEMISDWAAANFALRNIAKNTSVPPLENWFDNTMAQLPWTEHQIDLIKKSFQIIQDKTDKNKLNLIWQNLVKIIQNI